MPYLPAVISKNNSDSMKVFTIVKGILVYVYIIYNVNNILYLFLYLSYINNTLFINIYIRVLSGYL